MSLRAIALASARGTQVTGQETREEAARSQKKRTLEPHILDSNKDPPLALRLGNYLTFEPQFPHLQRGESPPLGRTSLSLADIGAKGFASGRSSKNIIIGSSRQRRAEAPKAAGADDPRHSPGPPPVRLAPLTSSRLRTARTTRKREERSS